jgi:hypothetical protein
MLLAVQVAPLERAEPVQPTLECKRRYALKRPSGVAPGDCLLDALPLSEQKKINFKAAGVENNIHQCGEASPCVKLSFF